MSTRPTVTRLEPAEIDAAAELLARAFHDQPYETYYEPDGSRRLELLRAAFVRQVRDCVDRGDAGHLPGGGRTLQPGRPHDPSCDRAKADRSRRNRSQAGDRPQPSGRV